MEMDRGRANSRALASLRKAKSICADALDQLGGGGGDRIGQAGAGSAFRFSLTFGLEVFFWVF